MGDKSSRESDRSMSGGDLTNGHVLVHNSTTPEQAQDSFNVLSTLGAKKVSSAQCQYSAFCRLISSFAIIRLVLTQEHIEAVIQRIAKRRVASPHDAV